MVKILGARLGGLFLLVVAVIDYYNKSVAAGCNVPPTGRAGSRNRAARYWWQRISNLRSSILLYLHHPRLAVHGQEKYPRQLGVENGKQLFPMDELIDGENFVDRIIVNLRKDDTFGSVFY